MSLGKKNLSLPVLLFLVKFLCSVKNPFLLLLFYPALKFEDIICRSMIVNCSVPKPTNKKWATMKKCSQIHRERENEYKKDAVDKRPQFNPWS